MSVELCFACGKPLKGDDYADAVTIDGQRVFVGPDCFKRIQKAGAKGWQPQAGGPKLYLIDDMESYRG